MNNKGFESVILQPSFDLLAHPKLLCDNFKNWKRAVVINQLPQDDFAYVTVDQEACGYLATQYLIDKGHRQIVCLGRRTIQRNDPILAARTAGYKCAMDESGLKPLVLNRERRKKLTIEFLRSCTPLQW